MELACGRLRSQQFRVLAWLAIGAPGSGVNMVATNKCLAQSNEPWDRASRTSLLSF